MKRSDENMVMKQVMKWWWKFDRLKQHLQAPKFFWNFEASVTSQMELFSSNYVLFQAFVNVLFIIEFQYTRFHGQYPPDALEAQRSQKSLLLCSFRNRSTKPCFSNFLVLSRIEHWTMKWWRMLCLEVTRTLSSLDEDCSIQTVTQYSVVAKPIPMFDISCLVLCAYTTDSVPIHDFKICVSI